MAAGGTGPVGDASPGDAPAGDSSDGDEPTALPGSPFAPGSLVYKPYVVDGSAGERIADLIAQVRTAESAGFDGVCVSEHHLGFPGYLPNPFQAVDWILHETHHIWAAPAPALVLLRPLDLVIEELAWLGARFPGRVGAAFAAGAVEADFTLAGTDQADLASRFESALGTLVPILSGEVPERLDADPAMRELSERPIPVLSAASSLTACRRAARIGCGILLESSIDVAEVARQVRTYREAGGRGPAMVVRRVWVGSDPPVELEQARDRLVRSTVPSYNRSAWLEPDRMIVHGTAEEVADQLAAVLSASGADSLTLRTHVPGLGPEEVRAQVRALGDVLDRLRATLRSRGVFREPPTARAG